MIYCTEYEYIILTEATEDKACVQNRITMAYLEVDLIVIHNEDVYLVVIICWPEG